MGVHAIKERNRSQHAHNLHTARVHSPASPVQTAVSCEHKLPGATQAGCEVVDLLGKCAADRVGSVCADTRELTHCCGRIESDEHIRI